MRKKINPKYRNFEEIKNDLKSKVYFYSVLVKQISCVLHKTDVNNMRPLGDFCKVPSDLSHLELLALTLTSSLSQNL